MLELIEMGSRGLEAIALWTLAGSYTGRHLTGGRVPRLYPRRKLGKVGERAAALLVEVGLWDEHDDGWAMHDHGHYNPDRDELHARRAARAEAGRLGGRRSGETRRSKPEANASHETKQERSKPEALASTQSNPVPSRPVPTREEMRVPTEPSRSTSSRAAGDEPAKEPKRRGPPPGLARLIAVQRELGGEAIDNDPALGIAYAKVRGRGDDALEAAVRRAWRDAPHLDAIRSLRWLLSNLDQWLARGPTVPALPRTRSTQREADDALFDARIREAEERERAAQKPITATEVQRVSEP